MYAALSHISASHFLYLDLYLILAEKAEILFEASVIQLTTEPATRGSSSIDTSCPKCYDQIFFWLALNVITSRINLLNQDSLAYKHHHLQA